MAGDWIKIEHALPQKTEVFGIARRVGQSRAEVVGRLVTFWSWADENSVDGNNLTLTSQEVDEIVGLPGFAAAMRAEGWLGGRDNSLQLPNWQRHNGNSAKARALEKEAKRLRRLSDDPSEDCPTKPAENVGLEKSERRARGEPIVSNRERTDRGNHSGRSQLNAGEDGEPPDLSGLDWARVLSMVVAAAKRVPPRTEDDRRAWLRYGVMAELTFDEAWLVGSAEIVANAKETKRTRQAHFVAVLKAKAKASGIDGHSFNAIARRIEIPDDIWQSDVLGGPPR